MSHLELGAQLSKHFAGPDVLDADTAQHIRCDKRFHFSRSTIAGADRQAEVAASNVARIRGRLNAREPLAIIEPGNWDRIIRATGVQHQHRGA
jgi:hypothetical protein